MQLGDSSTPGAIFSCFQGDIQHDTDNCTNLQFVQSVEREAAALFQYLLPNWSPGYDLSAKIIKCLSWNNWPQNYVLDPFSLLV